MISICQPLPVRGTGESAVLESAGACLHFLWPLACSASGFAVLWVAVMACFMVRLAGCGVDPLSVVAMHCIPAPAAPLPVGGSSTRVRWAGCSGMGGPRVQPHSGVVRRFGIFGFLGFLGVAGVACAPSFPGVSLVLVHHQACSVLDSFYGLFVVLWAGGGAIVCCRCVGVRGVRFCPHWWCVRVAPLATGLASPVLWSVGMGARIVRVEGSVVRWVLCVFRSFCQVGALLGSLFVVLLGEGFWFLRIRSCPAWVLVWLCGRFPGLCLFCAGVSVMLLAVSGFLVCCLAVVSLPPLAVVSLF